MQPVHDRVSCLIRFGGRIIGCDRLSLRTTREPGPEMDRHPDSRSKDRKDEEVRNHAVLSHGTKAFWGSVPGLPINVSSTTLNKRRMCGLRLHWQYYWHHWAVGVHR